MIKVDISREEHKYFDFILNAANYAIRIKLLPDVEIGAGGDVAGESEAGNERSERQKREPGEPQRHRHVRQHAEAALRRARSPRPQPPGVRSPCSAGRHHHVREHLQPTALS